MNKALTVLMGLAFATGVFASDTLLPASITFNSPNLWGKTVRFGLDDNGDYSGISHWYYYKGESSSSVIMHDAGEATGYLMVGTAGSLHRTIEVTEADGPSPTAGQKFTTEGLYFDTKVIFSAFVSAEMAESAPEDKISCWVCAPKDSNTTNFIVTAGIEQDGVYVSKDYVTTVTGVDFSKYHRLTLKAFLKDGVAGFYVYLDDVQVETEDGTTFFPSRCNSSTSTTSLPDTLYSFGFSGSGNVTKINFSRIDPRGDDTYDQDDVSTLQQYAEMTLSGYSQAANALYDFPLLVRISEDLIPKFRYSTAKPNGSDIRFTDSNGKLIPSEIDTWNTNGVSLIWVKVPYFINGTTVRMHWDLKAGCTAPANRSTQVWTDYIGVWHMSGADGVGSVKDSSGHNLTARMSGGALEVAPRSLVGISAYVAKAEGATDVTSLLTPNYEDLLDDDGLFTFTGWYLASDYDASTLPSQPFAGLKYGVTIDDSAGWGAQAVGRTTLKLNGSSNKGSSIEVPDLTTNWFHVGFVKDSSTTFTTFLNGRSVETVNGSVNSTTRKFQVMLNGFCADEVRLAKVVRSEAWIKAEMEMATNVNILSYSQAATKGLHNIWLVEPWLDRTVVTPEEINTIGIHKGEPRYGEVVVSMYDDAGNRIEEIPPVLGNYKIVFTARDGKHEDLVRSFIVVVAEDRSYQTVSGNNRVMLFNSDDTEGSEVSLEGYWDVDSQTNAVWSHMGEPWSGDLPFVSDGDYHVYFEPETQRQLWVFINARIGNLFPSDTTLADGMNYLPWSSNGRRYLDSEKVADHQRYAGQLILQNVSDKSSGTLDNPAAVYSPTYSNGIGTVYFDAVNAYGGYRNELTFQIRRTGDTEWQTWPVDVFGVVDGVYNAEYSTNNAETIVMNMQKDQGTTNWFYRVRATVDMTNSVCFRIIRTDYEDEGWGTGGLDGEGLILMDNIVVSAPAMGITISQYGEPVSTNNRLLAGWRLAPFDVPYPTAGDAVHARLRVTAIANDGSSSSAADLAELVTMWGRRRYLNQDIQDWQEYRLYPTGEDDGQCFQTTETLPLSSAGDFEYYFEAVGNAPYYKFCDYSGLSGWSWPDGFTERRTKVVLSAERDGIYADNYLSPALGKNYFVRLRDGASELESVEVVLGGAIKKDLKMQLTGSHSWHALLVSTNAVGGVSFYFRENKRQTPGSFEYNDKIQNMYPAEDAPLPSNGEATTEGEPKYFTTDGASNYIEFRYSDDTGAFSIGHAEYQNFNTWHDCNLDDELFTGSYAETSSVNTVAMTMTNAHMNTWSPLVTTNSNWNENFYLVNYEDEGYPKNVSYVTHKMPHLWSGENGMFTDAKLVQNTGLAKTNDSGIAWQMRGSTYGSVEYTQTSGPSGVDTVSFQAHLAQSISFNDFSVWNGDGANEATNYTFVIPALMSAKSGNDMAPGAAMSIVAYYRPHLGAYELRIERLGTDGLQFSIYKWTEENYSIEPQLLGTKWYDNATFQVSDTSGKPNMFGMFISVGMDVQYPKATTIIAGLTEKASSPLSNFSGTTLRAICCVDNSSTRLTKGAFGVLTKNCTGTFLTPQHFDRALPVGKLTGAVDVDDPITLEMYPMFKKYLTAPTLISFAGTRTSDQGKFSTDWDYVPGRIEIYTNRLYASYDVEGLRAPLNLVQTVEVCTKTKDDADAQWNCVKSVPVSGYGFSTYKAVIQTPTNSYVRLRTGSVATDVTVWDIKQTSWRGEDIANINSLSRDFIYTQGRVIDTSASGYSSHAIMLQPKRALASRPLSIRGPILKGLGMIGFSFSDVQPGCELLVQIATNKVSANMSTLNQSLVEGEGVGEWTTVKTITYDELSSINSRSVYIGLHDRENDTVQGVIRLIVSPTVVELAAAASDASYGSITITDVWVQDEPWINTHCWRGFNIRTLGDSIDSEQRMYLPDGRLTEQNGMGSYGLSGALNDSVSDSVAGELADYNLSNPYLQSPTFGSYTNGEGVITKAGIGLVRFRARLYNRSTNAAPAHVSVYGTVDGADDEWGDALTNITITSTNFRSYEFKATGKKKYSAMRLVIDGVLDPSAVSYTPHRVVFDDVVVSEKSESAVGFCYARPFRTGVNSDIEITDILTREQQPLCGESWGIQAKLRMPLLGNEVDTNRGFRVMFQYFVGDTPWGYENWRENAEASTPVALKQIGAFSDYLFRSTVEDPNTIVPPQGEAGTIIQYMVTVYYYLLNDDERQEQNIVWSSVEGQGWMNPTWYAPVNLNETYADLGFSPYTILDNISPGRAWINELNYNDGPRRQEGNNGVVPTTNQFIEIAVPAGVDMTGWKVRVTDMDYYSYTIATLGKNGVAGSKMTSHQSGDYDFLVIQSPATKTAGGIHDPDGGLAADGTWTSETMSANFKSGTFRYGQPYEVALYRASGIMEHQFVVMGTNEYAATSYGYQYEGTNLVNELDVEQSETTRFYAGKDEARMADEVHLASIGVTGAAHGEEGGWKEKMSFTAGRLNEDQDELTDWYLHPNGTNIWVYAQVVGTHIQQVIGSETNRDMFVIVPAGGDTNIEYTIGNWYQMDSMTINGVTNELAKAKKGLYTLELTNIVETTRVVVREGISSEVIDAGLDPDDPYTPAVMRWLEGGKADGVEFASPSGPIQLAQFKGLQDTSNVTNLTLRDMYWLDLDPTKGGWWLRAGVSNFNPPPTYRKRQLNEQTMVYYTNRQIQVTMFLSNALDRTIAPYAPKRLQGLGGEKSDEFKGAWTSETFKVRGELQNGSPHNLGFLPLRWFVFGPDSFYPATSKDKNNPPFSATIEILDPFSVSSPGYSYGWYGYGMYAVWFRWSVDATTQATTVETLNKSSVYDKLPYQSWDGKTIP